MQPSTAFSRAIDSSDRAAERVVRRRTRGANTSTAPPHARARCAMSRACRTSSRAERAAAAISSAGAPQRTRSASSAAKACTLAASPYAIRAKYSPTSVRHSERARTGCRASPRARTERAESNPEGLRPEPPKQSRQSNVSEPFAAGTYASDMQPRPSGTKHPSAASGDDDGPEYNAQPSTWKAEPSGTPHGST